MGICTSCESTTVATAKVILENGELQEFPYPVKVSHLLNKNPSSFICNSDDMEFEDFVTAMSEHEDIRPGHLYFVLPLSKLKYPLQAEEMAALAVKASLALMKSGCCDRAVDPNPNMSDASYHGKKPRLSGAVKRKSGRSSCKSGGRNFVAELSMIPE